MSGSGSFLFDEQISSRISSALQVMGEPCLHVVTVDDLGRGATDAQILPYCGRFGLTLVTLDRRMLASPHLHGLIHEFGVGAFFVSSQRRKETPPPWLIFRTLVKHWEEIRRIADEEARPFMKLVQPSGQIISTGWKPSNRRRRR